MIRYVGWIAALVLLSWISVWPQSPSASEAVAPPAASRGPSGAQPTRSEDPEYAGNEACAACHASIYQSYARTPMAHASGPATANVISADFIHSASGVHYRIYSEKARVWLSLERPGDPAVNGKRELLYYIGSGRRGLAYLFARDGFLFESPINWYGRAQRWDMAPAYQNATEIPLNLPVVTRCLRCHVSEMQAPVKGTENLYPRPVFLEPGVGCERCHGPGAAHIAAERAAPAPIAENQSRIVNPAKLSPDLRDAVCMQCHMEGKVAIERTGRHAYDFRPGESLSDYIRYYVPKSNHAGELGGVSQVEALAQSECKKKSGDAMSCVSCHDPHSEPSAAERVSFYRQKCLACHGELFGARHHIEQPDCTSCHMAALPSSDVAHTQVTDHRILRHPAQVREDTHSSTLSILPFPNSAEAEHDVRDLALAWQALADGGMSTAEPRAETLLRSAASRFPNDPEILSGLAYVEQRQGSTRPARELYQRALAADPSLIDAADNLGVIEAESGHVREAVELWQAAFERAPGRSSIGLNLARSFCALGRFDDARSYTLRVLEFNPDMGVAKNILRSLNRTPPVCAN